MTIEIKKTFKNIDDGIANMIAAANFDYENANVSDEMKAKFKKIYSIVIHAQKTTPLRSCQ